jgi:hypothetical protein
MREPTLVIVRATLRQRNQGVGFGLRQICRHMFRTTEDSNLQHRGGTVGSRVGNVLWWRLLVSIRARSWLAKRRLLRAWARARSTVA